MDLKLRKILEDFSYELHNYEVYGGEFSQEVDNIWARLTDFLMEEEEEHVF